MDLALQAGTLKQTGMVPTNACRGAQRSSPSTQHPGWVLPPVPPAWVTSHVGKPCGHDLGEVTRSWGTCW